MDYSIRELSELAGVSARTLRYYDEIGLLKPKYIRETGYRFYGEGELALLQQILFYRERNLDLKKIKRILYQPDFDAVAALEEHLLELEEQKARMEALILTVKHTLCSMKGEYDMSDREKFEAFKKKAVEENEAQYGEEVREKFGDEQMDESNRKILSMSKENWERFQKLEEKIRKSLEEGVRAKIKPESKEAGEIVKLHKEWLNMTWKKYQKEAHRELAKGYVLDERFKSYYDRNLDGCAVLLRDAVLYWV